jgi:LysM repeat protein
MSVRCGVASRVINRPTTDEVDSTISVAKHPCLVTTEGLMNRRREPRPRIAALRAIALTALAVGAATVTWRLRPTTDVGGTAPDAAIVWCCAWLAWLLAGYLAVATAAAALGHLLGGLGRAGKLVRRLAPRQLRHLVDAAITTTVAASIVGTAAAAPAGAAPQTAVVSERAPLVAGSPLDWPGLTTTSPHHDRHHHHRGGGSDPPQHPQPPSTVATRGNDVVVQPGDTLWRIAARELGPGASGAAITEAWHAWYRANHAVIGPNPSIIRPGQRLRAPDRRSAH